MQTAIVSVYSSAPMLSARPWWTFEALVPATRREAELGLTRSPGRAMLFHDARAVTLAATPFALDVYALLRSSSGPESYLVRAARAVAACAPGIVSWPGLTYTCVLEMPRGAGPLVPGDVLVFG
jgi:hypothetical protein